MTLESAIKHAEQVAVREDNNAQVYDKVKNDNLYHPDKITCEQAAKRCRECAAEHRQLAEWLKELKERREKDVSDINVGDMVSRQKAIDAIVNCTNCGDEKTLRAYVQKHNLDNGWTGGVLEAIDAIEDLPSAKPEIIRCKDCKWWSNDDYRECSSPNYDDGYVTPAGFYCGYAERRTDD